MKNHNSALSVSLWALKPLSKRTGLPKVPRSDLCMRITPRLLLSLRVFKRAFTADSAASCPQGTVVFVLMAGSHPLLFICSRFAGLTFRCPLLYVPIIAEGRRQGLSIPLGSHVERHSLTAACCSIFFF